MVARNYLFYRATTTLAVVFGVSVLTFALVALTPGDPATTILRQRLGQVPPHHVVAAFRSQHGLDDPFVLQYGRWLLGVIHGDLGTSYYSDRAVSSLLVGHALPTVVLAVAAMAVALVVSIPAGVLSAVHRGEWIDFASRFGALVGVAMPNFWFGYVLIIVFSLQLGLFPVAGTGGVSYLVLPALTLGTGLTAIITRFVRTATLEELGRPSIDMARSKGLDERIVVYKHALRNALVPVVTVVGLQFGYLLSGAVVVEIVFQRPGLGTLLVDAVSARDYPVVQGVILLISVCFVVLNFLVDLTYRHLDPRIGSRSVNP
ncbi:nickel ABC transporter permease [Halococcus sp. IIIV-5B]|uniref:nickel ABC transporter permease n=1 Tax=Halococcus sp. IIIV-5B TaxID=2321230 RepID=UPI000E75FD42|nr:nickel ABC transporter permease [Halococcus sp. IIIV-5B]RJT07424.1 ABC transporter permease [Halococcus sp. IIIV-5B]